MARSQADIQADIDALTEARRKRLLGQVNSRVGYEDASVEKSLPTFEEINMELARLQLELASVTGEASGLGPIRPTHGSGA